LAVKGGLPKALWAQGLSSTMEDLNQGYSKKDKRMTTHSTSSVEKRAVNKAAWRILPLLIVCYIIASIDRTNISFAASGGMSEDLALTATQYGFAAGIFFISYFLFEVPSNLMLEKFGARKWIARIMLTWGAFAMMAAFVNHVWALYAIRF